MTAGAMVTIDPDEFGKAMGQLIKDATAPLLKRIVDLEARQPEKGERGEPGPKGEDAPLVEIKDVVAELLASEELRILTNLQVTESVAKHFEANPVKHGVDG